MLMSSSPSVKGSAGYVAIEKVTGTLNGRHGSFYLQHNGTMTRGVGELTITVIPDSGTDELDRPARQDEHHHCRRPTLVRV